MFEIVFELSSLADTAVFYGINNSNMQLIKNLHPNLRIVARGNVIKIIGNQQDADKLIVNLQKLEKFSIDNNQLTEQNIIELVKGENPKEISFQNLIMHGVGGKSIFARTKNQQRLVEEFEKNDLLFAIGPAGSGKTYTAIALAVRALKNKQIKKIILSRPAVEAGEKLGFLPGDMKEKIDPYLQPLYDALQDMITPLKLKEYMENGTIQIAPLAFMRGRTLSDAVVILDEAQNSTIMQIKMFLTRMGLNTKMIVTGDITQIDLPRDQKSGLIDALNLLGNIKGIARIDFDVNDIVRHRLVQQIVQAYDNRAMIERQKNTKE
ncbi:MAG TPA: PhoH family protein [Paludibacteraceae bacterium]|nr:PhoH family protein [Paludibacteraceae bacterium]HPD59098.1 PhoH family protein [Paludibacteraceae bacterium]HRS24157.1 PhoH family protein [Paludibacteraceae bacterium]